MKEVSRSVAALGDPVREWWIESHEALVEDWEDLVEVDDEDEQEKRSRERKRTIRSSRRA